MNPDHFQQAGWATDTWDRPNANRLAVFFHREQVPHAFKTKEEGRPVFVEKIMITKVPADQHLRVTRPIREEDKIEFAQEWERFEKTGESRVLGTELATWKGISDTQKAEFRAAGIQTVEQLANATDAFIQRWMGGADIRQKARQFVAGQDADLIAKMEAEHRSKMDAMEKQMAEMKAMLESLTAPKAK